MYELLFERSSADDIHIFISAAQEVLFSIHQWYFLSFFVGVMPLEKFIA